MLLIRGTTPIENSFPESLFLEPRPFFLLCANGNRDSITLNEKHFHCDTCRYYKIQFSAYSNKNIHVLLLIDHLDLNWFIKEINKLRVAFKNSFFLILVNQTERGDENGKRVRKSGESDENIKGRSEKWKENRRNGDGRERGIVRATKRKRSVHRACNELHGRPERRVPHLCLNPSLFFPLCFTLQFILKLNKIK